MNYFKGRQILVMISPQLSIYYYYYYLFICFSYLVGAMQQFEIETLIKC